MSVSLDRGQTFSAPQKLNEKKGQTPIPLDEFERARRPGVDGACDAGSSYGGANASIAGGKSLGEAGAIKCMLL